MKKFVGNGKHLGKYKFWGAL